MRLHALALALCDDKPTSYGAPDVLTVSADKLVVQYCMDNRQVRV